jgi:hypothetical protein
MQHTNNTTKQMTEEKIAQIQQVQNHSAKTSTQVFVS